MPFTQVTQHKVKETTLFMYYLISLLTLAEHNLELCAVEKLTVRYAV